MSGLVGDEIHEWSDGRLYTFVHQSSAARRQPLEFLISTAGERAGYGWDVWGDCQKILSGDIDDPETLVVIYAADPDDDWTLPETWAKDNHNLGVSVKLEYLTSECQKARELPRLENDFKRYHLNIWTEQAVRWLPIAKWDACEEANKDVFPVGGWREMAARLQGRLCFAGIDLSSTTDLTAYVLVFPPEQEGGAWHVLPRFFLPAARIAERVRRDRVRYDEWARAGALIVTPGNVVDYGYLKHELFADAERYRLRKVALDPWNATQLAVEINAEGLEAVLFRQGYLSMSGPSKELERLVLSGKIIHGGHPVLRWNVGNVAVDSDAAGNIKPAKDKSTERIDGVVGLIEGLGVALAEPPAPRTYIQDNEMVVL
ncbi:MAG: terminase large subunit [Sphingomonadales bacterium]|nr:terminase large subunit [Sphingomonadales bacterium]